METRETELCGLSASSTPHFPRREVSEAALLSGENAYYQQTDSLSDVHPLTNGMRSQSELKRLRNVAQVSSCL